ncbi:DUF1097 domain-containing protein [Paraburkholderia ferrariae]|uniref:DUF1097 domain-containing protein n=1 Tax=Paraburkholderia ferrariae TaxID=386056 RepID=UPI00048A2624|nr:DUF1097 domain-containing protein [Paraburkholderia ferrariae]
MLIAYAISGAIIGAIATWSFLAFSGLPAWCAFIAWAALLHSGSEKSVPSKTISCMCFGVFLSWGMAVALISNILPFSTAINGAILVAAAVPLIIASSRWSALSITPAVFYGFASTFGFLVQTPGKLSLPALTEHGFNNPAIVVLMSMAIGVALGYLHVKLASIFYESLKGRPGLTSTK